MQVQGKLLDHESPQIPLLNRAIFGSYQIYRWWWYSYSISELCTNSTSL